MIHNDSTPKISCLLVTAAGRLEHFERSLRCYEDQTYPNRELVIVNEGPPEYQHMLAERVKHRSDVRLEFLRGRYTLGGLRNIAVGLAFGDLWVQWDDDDFNMPNRLAVQSHYLLRNPEAKACFLSEQLHYYFPTRQLFWNNWQIHSGGHKRFGAIPGTILAHKDGFSYRYPSSGDWARAGEDSVLVGDMCRIDPTSVVLLSGYGHMHIYSYHGKNVWDVEHHLNISRVRGMSCAHMIKNRELLVQTLRYMDFSDTVNVMGSEGLAFIYRRNYVG